MSNVSLTIGGRAFTVACAAGEEAHVTGLGRMIESKVATMGDAATQGEARMMLYAALLLADELHEARNPGGAATAPPPPPVPDDLADRLDALGERLEKLAGRLEGERSNA
jgi:cell division protein ZapA